MRDALLSMTEVLPRRGSRRVDTRLTASTVDIEVAFSSLPVGVQAQGECRFERIVTLADGVGELKDRRALILPKPNNDEDGLLLGRMALRKGMTWEAGGSLTERCDSELDMDVGADMEEVC
jgi:hypothetical protein